MVDGIPLTCKTRARVRPPSPAPMIVTGVVMVSSKNVVRHRQTLKNSFLTNAFSMGMATLPPRSAGRSAGRGYRDGRDSGDQDVEHPGQPVMPGPGEQVLADAG